MWLPANAPAAGGPWRGCVEYVAARATYSTHPRQTTAIGARPVRYPRSARPDRLSQHLAGAAIRLESQPPGQASGGERPRARGLAA